MSIHKILDLGKKRVITNNVKIKDNEYYDRIHAELSKKYGVEELTAAQMGGLECGKCHY